MMISAPGFRKLTTALFPEGDIYLASDPVFGVRSEEHTSELQSQ